MAAWFLQSVEITGGFLPGISLKFPRGLTCIIGPRGSGKSTLMEALRYGFGGLNYASKSRLDLIQANLGSSVLTLKTASNSEGISYIVRRTFREPASLLTADGETVADVNLERGTFLPLDAYNSAEIEAIADETLGEKRRGLLDELRADEIQHISLKLSEERRALESNADSIRAAKRSISDLNEQIEELGNARARLASMPALEVGAKMATFAKAVQQQSFNESEGKLIATLEDTVSQYVTELTETGKRLGSELVPVFDSETQNAKILNDLIEVTRVAHSNVEARIGKATEELISTLPKLKAIEATLLRKHAEQRAEFEELQKENAATSHAVQERSLAEKAVKKLEALEKQRVEAKATLRKLLEQRKTLKGNFLLTREKISSLRESIALQLQEKAGSKVRVRVLRNSDTLQYQQLLTEGLKGARVRNHEDILASLLRLRPEHLAQMIQDGDLADFESQLGLGQERAQRVLDAFRQNLDPLALEIIEIQDRICIELNVASEPEPNFKDASQLSRGQKCTALLPILLARRENPLVIDQPEDNLDNHFIYETVVETVRRIKAGRQMIFITHNANIPVLGEADLVIVLDSDGRKGFVRKMGTLDECRDEIVDLLEGGKEAFELRRKRYARS